MENGAYQLNIETRLADVDGHMIGCCHVQLGRDENAPAFEDLSPEESYAVIGLLVQTTLMSLAKQDPYKRALFVALDLLGITSNEENSATFDLENSK